MIHTIKEHIKTITPNTIILWYHKVLSYSAALWYRFPSREMLVIGVTGTNGKSTTCHLIARVLEATNHKVGMATTAEFQIGTKRWLNDTKMTMLGRFALQKMLRKMADENVKYAVIEVSSQGMEQHRADNIDFDIAVFTNLTPEHIEAHGSFEVYKRAKGSFFASLARARKKYSRTQGDDEVVYADKHYDEATTSEKICKTIIVNGDDEHADYFLSFDAQEKYCYGIEREEERPQGHSHVKASQVALNGESSTFYVGSEKFHIQLPGGYNVYNALAAITVGLTRGMGFWQLSRILAGPIDVPGRFERINEGQDFRIIIDYAPEPTSLNEVYKVIDNMEKKRVIHVLGSCGGGRDVSRRPVLGSIAARHADIVVVTNEDPYDDDPMEIIEDVAKGAHEQGKILNETLFTILDREDAIQHAVNTAQAGDIVLITGKGAEQAMCVAGGKKITWDDREVAKQAIIRKKFT